MKTQIGVTLQIEGFHNWPDAPDEVAFLRQRHRHIFHIECCKRVNHDDRDIEFVLFKRVIQKHLLLTYYVDEQQGNCTVEFGAMSCEMIARELVDIFDLDWCKVSEDKENYAIVAKEL